MVKAKHNNHHKKEQKMDFPHFLESSMTDQTVKIIVGQHWWHVYQDFCGDKLCKNQTLVFFYAFH